MCITPTNPNKDNYWYWEYGMYLHVPHPLKLKQDYLQLYKVSHIPYLFKVEKN